MKEHSPSVSIPKAELAIAVVLREWLARESAHIDVDVLGKCAVVSLAHIVEPLLRHYAVSNGGFLRWLAGVRRPHKAIWHFHLLERDDGSFNTTAIGGNCKCFLS